MNTLIDTAIGPIDAADLCVELTHSDTAVGPLTTTTYLYRDQVVKVDQDLKVSEAALEAAGIGRIG